MGVEVGREAATNQKLQRVGGKICSFLVDGIWVEEVNGIILDEEWRLGLGFIIITVQ